MAMWPLLLLGSTPARLGAQQAKADTAAVAGKSATDTAAAVKLPAEQLDALVAPIALYPDPLLAQTLVAATYPLELIQLHQWMAKHPELKDKALADSVSKQPWDPSIQSMAAVPDLVKRLSDDIQWTTDLGNAFLAQQAEVMEAVQRMRSKAKKNGALESNEQQKVETKKVEEKTVIVVEQTNPEVVYVPSYNPTYVYGPPVYPYPPVYYPPYTPGAAFVSFSFGFMMGAAMWGGSCCYAGWGGGGNNIYINNNNNFNKINNINGGNRNQINNGGRGNNWNHNPSHRGGAPYGDRATANKFGGSSGGVSDRAGGRGQGGAGVSDRAGGAGASNRAGAGASDRASAGSLGQRNPSASDRSSMGGGSDRVGSRDIPKGSGTRSNGLNGGSSGFSGSGARASSSRGASSMGSRGGGSRGGGGGRRR